MKFWQEHKKRADDLQERMDFLQAQNKYFADELAKARGEIAMLTECSHSPFDVDNFHLPTPFDPLVEKTALTVDKYPTALLPDKILHKVTHVNGANKQELWRIARAHAPLIAQELIAFREWLENNRAKFAS